MNTDEKEGADRGANYWNVVKTDDQLPGTVQIGRTLAGMVPRDRALNLCAWLVVQGGINLEELRAEVEQARVWLKERIRRSGGGET